MREYLKQSRKRKREIVDIPLTRVEKKKLKKGYRIYKCIKQKLYCVYYKIPITDSRINNALSKINMWRKKLIKLKKEVENAEQG